MSLFIYVAMDAKGRRKKGDIEAESERSARQLLKSRQLVVRSLNIMEDSLKNDGVSRKKRLNSNEITLFLQQLSTLSEAGMPLVEALAAIAEGMDTRRAKQVVVSVRQFVLEGGSLAEALKQQGFEETICNMVAAGEETGQLEAVSSRLAELLERRQEMSQELLSATLYPAIILGFGLVVMLFLLAVVVPQVVVVFERSGGELPWLTKFVIALSTGLQEYGFLLIIVVAASVLAYITAMRKEEVRYQRDMLLLKMPGISSLLAKIDTARFSRTLGMLLAGGVPTLSAMHIASQNLGMLPIREVGQKAQDSLREGGNLSEALKLGGYIPHLAIQLIAVGEQSGRLDAMLIRVAENYESEATRNMKRLLTIMEPALVMLMAGMVGALAMAILLPIIEMNELVR